VSTDWWVDDSEGAAGSPDESLAAPSRILVVEDEETIRELLTEILVEDGYNVDTAADGRIALRRLDENLYDVVLIDINIPGPDGMAVLSAAPSFQTDAQFIITTAFGSVETAVEAMKLGAFDYVRKPFKTDELLLTVSRALEQLRLRREVAQLRRRASGGGHPAIIGKTRVMQRVYELIERVAPTRAPVLITGETGTGKELVAQAVHDYSDRSRKSFVPVNCSALPETLLESELFGHMKGSFTGAHQNRRGLFEEASGGTLFLDEISAVSQAIQVKLLRVLQERRIKRVGGREEIPVDFRLIAATNEDLARSVEDGRFREDLFYRLNVFPIEVPPLRERRDDIPLLANHFRLRFAEENEIEAPEIPPKTLKRMMDYEWPGNVRELENFVSRSVIMHAGAETIPFDHESVERMGAEQSVLAEGEEEGWSLDRLEREYILRTLDRTRWHQGNAADVLGINRRTLYRKLKQYREEGIISEDAGDGSED